MITISKKKLVDLVHNGALANLFAVTRPLQASWANRRQVAFCNEQFQLYNEKVLSLCEKYGTRSPRNPNAYVFDADDTNVLPGEVGPKRKLYDQEVEELGNKVIDVPGLPTKVSEASGYLSMADCDRLDGTFLID